MNKVDPRLVMMAAPLVDYFEIKISDGLARLSLFEQSQRSIDNAEERAAVCMTIENLKALRDLIAEMTKNLKPNVQQPQKDHPR